MENKKKVLQIQVINLALMSIKISPQTPEGIAQAINVARQELFAGNFKRAFELFQEFHKKYESVEIVNDMACCLFNMQRAKDALDVLGELLKKHNKEAVLYYNIGVMLYEFAEFRKASEYFEQACSLDSHNISFKINYSLALLKCFKFDDALTVISVAENLLTQDIQDLMVALVFHTKAVILFFKKEIENALENFEKCKIILGEDRSPLPLVLNNIGCTLYALGRDEEGFSYFEKAATMASNSDEKIFLNLGRAYLLQKEKASEKEKLSVSNVPVADIAQLSL